MSDYEFSLPWAPSVNGYRACVRNRLITTSKGRKYKSDVVSHMKYLGLFGERLGGRLSVSIVLNPPTLAKFDIDNYFKAILDAITEAEFWNDDSQIDTLRSKRGEKLQGGRVNIKVSVIEQ